MLRPILILGLCAGLHSAGADASQGKRNDPVTLSSKDRTSADLFEVRVFLPQTAIESTVDVGRVARPPSGGLLDTLIVYSLDDKKKILSKSLKDKAEHTILPIRGALSGFDVDALALTSSANALATIDWLRAGTPALHKDMSYTGQPGENLAEISFRYDLSPDFSSIRVFADVRLARNNAVVFKQTVTSIVQLKKRSFEHDENVVLWIEDDGKRAKDAIIESFRQMEQLIPVALNMTSADLNAFGNKNREQGFAAGYNGPIIKRGGLSPDDILIWSNGLLFLHFLP